jgi:SAM-dependent MidA family methyltransferase
LSWREAILTELGKWIREQIKERGQVPFAVFMEWALYHKTLGYYTSDRRKFGKAGDFYTSPGINPVFAEVLADELAKKAERLGGEAFSLIEFGAGEGMLARDLLNRWQDAHPALYERAVYRIVEISPALREVQKEKTASHAGKVVWMTREEVHAAGPYQGAVLTNEFVDAFPVHRIVKTEDGLKELYVRFDDEREAFVQMPGELSDERIGEYVAAYANNMVRGQVTEVGLAGISWYAEAMSLLTKGWLFTIDYGFEADMLHHPSRKDGTLRGFYRHALIEDPFANIGEQDLTADVNFTALREVGEQGGFVTEFFGSQSRYLLQAGILNRLKDVTGADLFRDPDMKRNRAIKQLILPGGIGDHFKVLLQSRGVSVL